MCDDPDRARGRVGICVVVRDAYVFGGAKIAGREIPTADNVTAKRLMPEEEMLLRKYCVISELRMWKRS